MLAELAKDIPFVFVSSDLVFDGRPIRLLSIKSATSESIAAVSSIGIAAALAQPRAMAERAHVGNAEPAVAAMVAMRTSCRIVDAASRTCSRN